MVNNEQDARLVRRRATGHQGVTGGLLCCLLAAVGIASAQGPPGGFHDIGSGGQPTISSAAYGGSVTGNPSPLADLQVTVNFGELSPINQDGMVKVVIPVAIRSTAAYQVRVTMTGSAAGDSNSLQLSDIGFGIANLRPLGGNAAACAANSVIASPFNNDPSASMTIGPTGRATYPSSLANISGSTLILNGPRLSVFSNIGQFKRENDNGWVFDAILAVAPQFYTPGNRSVTLTFAISSGPGFPC